MEVETAGAAEAAPEPAAEEVPAAAEEAPAEEAATSPTTEKKKPAKTPATKPKPTPASASTGTGGRVRRERKQVEFFAPVEAAKKEVEEVLAVGQGSGTKLRDIPNIAYKMGKLTGRDELIEGLHNVLFRRKGAATQRKKAVLDFSGFAFAEDQKEKELEARRASLGKWKLELVHRAMDLLDLQRGSGDKAAKVDRILEFLQEPKPLSDVDLASKEASKKEKEKAKRERAAAKKEKAKKEKEKAKKEKAGKRKSGGSAGRPAKKAKKAADEEDEEPEEESEAEEEEASEEEQEKGGESEEEEKLPAKKDRRASGGRQGKAAAKEAEEEAEAMEEEAQQQAEEEAHPSSKVPAEELKAEVEGILGEMEGADLPQITAKPILKKLEAKFGFSLKPRKQEVIAIAQAYVQAWLEAHPEAAEEEPAKAEEEPGKAEEAPAAAPEPQAAAAEPEAAAKPEAEAAPAPETAEAAEPQPE